MPSKLRPSAAQTSAPSITSILARALKATRASSPATSPRARSSTAGPGCRRFKVGDRVIVYHISGCGVCNDCRRGYMISCTSTEYRRAYGWQRDGGMAEYLLAEEKDLISLPGLAYLSRWRAGGLRIRHGVRSTRESRNRRQSCGTDHRAWAGWTSSRSPVPQAGCRKDHRHRYLRRTPRHCPELCAFVTLVLAAGPDNANEFASLPVATAWNARSIVPANAEARATAIRATRKWGRIVMVGEGGTVTFNPSPDIIHDQKTIYGSWVTSTWLMEELGRAARPLEPAPGRHRHPSLLSRIKQAKPIT